MAGTVEREIRNLARQANFRPATHHIEIYGTCQACQTAN
jgi:Fe2+ or Zn2+ uptake regulation protein